MYLCQITEELASGKDLCTLMLYFPTPIINNEHALYNLSLVLREGIGPFLEDP